MNRWRIVRLLGEVAVFIQSDLYRYYGNVRAKTLIGGNFLNRSFNYSLWLRLAKSGIPGVRDVAKFMHAVKTRRYGTHIPLEVDGGYGLYIAHGLPVVINPTARIGNNCNLSQFVTIGSNHGCAATIGNNVYVGPGVCMVENVLIGDDVIVGAGAAVVHDIASGTTSAGVPARPVGRNRYPEYVGDRWPPAGPISSAGDR